MRYPARALLAGGLGFAVAALVACGGGSGLLSADQASSLNGQLDQVSSALDARQCPAATSAANSLVNSVQNLQGVNSALVNNLSQGASTVASLTARDCQSQTTSTATTSTATTTSVQTHTSPPPTTTHTTTSPTQTTAPTATTAPSPGTTSSSGGAGITGSGGGNSGGAGSGNGNGQ